MSNREKLAEEYANYPACLDNGNIKEAFLAGWDARSKDVGELVNMIEVFIKNYGQTWMLNEARKILTKFKEEK
jgi:hypothetical protein